MLLSYPPFSDRNGKGWWRLARVVQVSFRYPHSELLLTVHTGSSAVTLLTCSVSFPTRLGSVPKRRNGSAARVFGDPTIRTPALLRSSRLQNGIKCYPLSHSPRPAGEVHNQSDLLLPTTGLRDLSPCNLCVGQTSIPSLGRKHHQNHLPVGLEPLQPIHHARPGGHRNRIIYPHGHTSGYSYRSSVSLSTVPACE